MRGAARMRFLSPPPCSPRAASRAASGARAGGVFPFYGSTSPAARVSASTEACADFYTGSLTVSEAREVMTALTSGLCDLKKTERNATKTSACQYLVQGTMYSFVRVLCCSTMYKGLHRASS